MNASLCRRALTAGLLNLSLVGAASAQAVFPPPELTNAPNFDAAMRASIGNARPELGTHLLMDLPDVVAPGAVQGRIESLLPGTVFLILLRGAYPQMAVGGDPVVTRPPPAPVTPVHGKAATPAKPITTYIEAVKLAHGQPARMKVKFDAAQTQWYTALAYAQGRWFVAAKEIKVGTPAPPKSTR